MRLRSWILVILACLIAVPAFAQQRAIAWQGKGADGQRIHFDPQHLQRPALLLFWATWCPYCEALMPYLQHVYDAAGKDKLDVYAIDIKDDGDPVATLRERKQTFTLVRDGDAIADQYGVKGTPGLFLVDAKGNIVYHRSGGDAPEKVEVILRAKLGLPPVKSAAG
jgi:thiol-disulfide isomerase/thioredoxin